MTETVVNRHQDFPLAFSNLLYSFWLENQQQINDRSEF